MLFTVSLLIVLFCLCSSCISFCLVVQEIVVVEIAGVAMQLNLSSGKKKGLGARLKGTRFATRSSKRARGTHAPKSIQSLKVRKSALFACPHKSTMLFLIFVFMFHWLSWNCLLYILEIGMLLPFWFDILQSPTRLVGCCFPTSPPPHPWVFWVAWFLVWFLVQLGPLVLFVLVPVKDDGFRWSIFHLTSSHHDGVFLCWGARLSMCKRWWINEVGGFVS